LVNDTARDRAGTRTWIKKMNRTKFGTQPSKFEGTTHPSSASAATLNKVDIDDDFDDLFEEDTDFDVEEDIAFLGEDYDVTEIDDVLELYNVGREDLYDA
jgi:hypothetical protein